MVEVKITNKKNGEEIIKDGEYAVVIVSNPDQDATMLVGTVDMFSFPKRLGRDMRNIMNEAFKEGEYSRLTAKLARTLCMATFASSETEK